MRVDIKKIFEVLDYVNGPSVDIQKDPFKVLVSTILSSRTKDSVTATVSDRLFSKVKCLEDLEKLDIKEIEKLIYPICFYRTKAHFLNKLPKVVKERFNGIIPDSIEELTELPGVGRKTANLVVSVAFNKLGICVDTHVHRIMNHLGFVKTKTPFETEMDLRKKLPKILWSRVNYYFVVFGQKVCRPISPFCSKCVIRSYCGRVGVVRSR